jgi:hypothetical protein
MSKTIASATLVLFSLLLSCGSPHSSIVSPAFRNVVVDNAQPRRDTRGQIIDAHDGSLQFFKGRYYLYGTAYGTTQGFTINNRYRVYSSPDLENWSFDGELLKAPPNGVYYRPYVVYNPTTHKYVLWYNWYPKLWEGKVGVAVSDTPVGPFKIFNPAVQLSQAADSPGDGSLFVDNDGTGYFIYTVINQNHAIRIERLTADYLASTGQFSSVLGTDCEAPALFSRAGRYYALFDSTCCFCSQGSGARVLMATSPLGPYTEVENINRSAEGIPTVGAQQTFVARLPSTGGFLYLWMADRWGSTPDGIKGHDFQFWAPLDFNSDGSLAPIKDISSWHAPLPMGAYRFPIPTPYSWPKVSDPNPLTINPCTGASIPPGQ